MARRRTRKTKNKKTLSLRAQAMLFVAFCAIGLTITLTNGQLGALSWDSLYDAAGLSSTVPTVEVGEATSENVASGYVATGKTEVHFIDVGQGDATLIIQRDSYALIDAGTNECEEELVGYLQALGITKLDYVIMTHPHADHIGAMDAILYEFEVGLLVLPDFDKASDFPTSQTFENVLTAIEETNTPTKTAEVGDVYMVGAGALVVMSTGVETDNYNDISICTRFTQGEFAFIATGDAEVEVEEQLVDSGLLLEAMLYKAGHHGSSTSNTEAFVQAVNPSVAVISCGVDNSYGHPHSEVLELFDAENIDTYCTADDGTVVVTYSAEDGMQVFT